MKYFTIKELCKSSEATRLGIKNEPTEAQERNIKALIDNVLDPLREAWGGPIIVNSGFRCITLNSVVGGAPTSQHKEGEAADIETPNRSKTTNKALFELILKMKLPFDQLINEYDYDWLHISYRANGKNRGEVLEAKRVGGKTKYFKKQL